MRPALLNPYCTQPGGPALLNPYCAHPGGPPLLNPYSVVCVCSTRCVHDRHCGCLIRSAVSQQSLCLQPVPVAPVRDAHRLIAVESGPCSVCLDGVASHICVPCGHVSDARKRATTTPMGPTRSCFMLLCSLCASLFVRLAHVVGFSVVDTCLCMRGVSEHNARTLPHLPRRMYDASTETNRSHAVVHSPSPM